MNIEKAILVRKIINEIEGMENYIREISGKDMVLCFGSYKPCDGHICSCVRHYVRGQQILDKYHKEIIQELKDEIKDLKKQLEEL